MTDRQPLSTGTGSSSPSRAGPDSTPSRIIRRAPTSAIPVVTSAQRVSPPIKVPASVPPAQSPPAVAAISACVLALIAFWATSVISTDLIASWWHTDRLFCIAVGFLSLVFAGTTVSGVIMLLLRRPVGRYLIAVGAVVALLTFGSLFVAGAKVPWVVHITPVVQVATVVAALLPATKRWAES